MQDRHPDLGPTGETVAANVRRLREEQNLSYPELERRLDAVGRRIPVLGLRRLEARSRRVDIDDLMALALVLGVSPSTLMTPNVDKDDEVVPVTGAGSVQVKHLWWWLLAQAPIDLEVVHTTGSEGPSGTTANAAQMRDFDRRAHPTFVLAERAQNHPARSALMRLAHYVALCLGRIDDEHAGQMGVVRYRQWLATDLRRELRTLQDLADDVEAGRDTYEAPPWERSHGDR